jgi:hypothetical protein
MSNSLACTKLALVNVKKLWYWFGQFKEAGTFLTDFDFTQAAQSVCCN